MIKIDMTFSDMIKMDMIKKRYVLRDMIKIDMTFSDMIKMDMIKKRYELRDIN